MAKADKYTYRVTWSEDDQEFVGLCAEFPSLSWLEEEQVEAFNGIRSLVADVLQDMKQSKEGENRGGNPRAACNVASAN